jgi:hypothetical protein
MRFLYGSHPYKLTTDVQYHYIDDIRLMAVFEIEFIPRF